ncbi:Hypothetical predicted protein [Lecanosticta acicola]|uniref:Pentatricopeptide repeat protein n=1 Tax=Lecanosticta acicola TaxID=111012 RepID=A0AAI8Z4C9_9PEZI|nr:Hypothetical predicted protein [Lecanosticta acicola]
MLAFHLQRAQLELSFHRAWLTSFTGRCILPTRRYASTDLDPISRLSGQRTSQKPKRTEKGTVKAAVKRKVKLRNQAFGVSQEVSKLPDAVGELLSAIEDYNINSVIAAYKALPESKPLTGDQTRALAQCVHECIRREFLFKDERARRRGEVDRLVQMGMRMVQDIRKGRLEPNVPAHVHLLGMFKESNSRDAGMEFWQWLETQDEDYVNLDCYAVAIDILAVNGAPLAELEELYQNALARFPGTFSAYHLAPNAIISDREREINIPDLPMQLLQSISHARLMRGETKKAYLGLDTALRIYPATLNERFLRVFKNERPLSEFYTIFAMFCRAGIPMAPNSFNGMLSQIRLNTDQHTHSRITLLRILLSAMYLQISAGGTILSNAVAEVIIAATQTLRLPGVASLQPQFRTKIVDDILDFCRVTMEVFARYGILPSISAFNSIITNVAGYGQSIKVVGIALRDMERLGLEPNEVTRRSLIVTAGLLRNGDLLFKSWRDIGEARKERGKHPDFLDFKVFITAARRIGNEDNVLTTARSEIEKYKAAGLSDYLQRAIDQQLSEDFSEASPSMDQVVDAGLLLNNIEQVKKDLMFIAEKTKDRPDTQDLLYESPPMTLLDCSPLNISDTEMRKIYDEYTTEQAAKGQTEEDQTEDSSSTETATSPPMSSTGIPFGQLRFENWKTVNYLLWLSEKHDRTYGEIVDDAIGKGVRPPPRHVGLTKDEMEEVQTRGFGFSEPKTDSPQISSAVQVANARDIIARLRTLEAE